MSRIIQEMDHGEHPRDRLRASETLLRVGGLLKEGSAAPVTVNVANVLGVEAPPRKAADVDVEDPDKVGDETPDGTPPA